MCRVPPARAELSAATASVAPWVSGDSVRGASPPSATTRLRTPSGSWSSRLVVPLMPFCSSPAPAAEVSSTVAVASCGPSTGLASVGSVPESPLATSNVPGWASDGGGSTPTIIVTSASPGDHRDDVQRGRGPDRAGPHQRAGHDGQRAGGEPAKPARRRR